MSMRSRVESASLKNNFMDCQHSCTSTLPWVWVFEFLTSSNQVDVSLLLDLLKKIPDVSDENCRKARELVSLRVLESLYAQKAHAHSVSTGASPKVGIDPSEHCEDVLLKILREMSVSDLKAAGAATLKWDIQPFIAHKRSCLTNCALIKLKDALLTGYHPSLVSLREHSGLPFGDQPGNRSPNDDGNYNSITDRLEGSNANTQFSSDNDQTTSLTLANGNFLKGRREILPAKRKGSAPTENAKKNTCTDLIIYESRENVSIKYNNRHRDEKPDAARTNTSFSLPCTQGTTDSQSLNLLVDTSKNIEQYSKRVRRSSRKKTCIRDIEHNRPPRDSNNECASSKRFVAPDGGSPCEIQALHHNIIAPNEKLDDENEKDRDNINAECDRGLHEHKKANEEMNKLDQDIPRNSRKVDEAEEVDISTDSEGYNEEISDIAAKKNNFLSSECTLSNTDCAELNLCIKCNGGGTLLVCCSNSCPLVIHDSCLGCDARFNEMGKFYCPFCVYSQAISKYKKTKERASYLIKKSKEKASLARNHLAAFFSGTRKGAEKQNDLEQDGDMNRNKERNNIDFSKKINMSECEKKWEHDQAGPSVLVPGDGPLRGKEIGSVHKIPHTSSNGIEEMEKRSKTARYRRVLGDHQMAATAVHISLGEKVTCQVSDRTGEHIETRSKNGASSTGLICESKCSDSIESADAEEISEEESKGSYPAKLQSKRRIPSWSWTNA